MPSRISRSAFAQISAMPTQNKLPSFTRHALTCTEEARLLLHSSLSQHLSIKAISRKVGLNPRSLQDCFKATYHKTIFEYGLDLRMEQGRKMLVETDMTLQNIAEQCGYAEQSNFGMAFKNKFGASPGEWRKANVM
jgi:AraC-like DNA-binding protein